MIRVDRFEGDVAVLEIAGQRVNVPRAELPAGTKEGDGLMFVRSEPTTDSDQERLARLKARAGQGPGTFDL